MSISELCVRRPVFATMLVMFLVVLGTFSFFDLGVDLFPKADPATVNVAVQLPGASPDELATAIVEPLEDALSSISGIDQMNSNMRATRCTIEMPAPGDERDAAQSIMWTPWTPAKSRGQNPTWPMNSPSLSST